MEVFISYAERRFGKQVNILRDSHFSGKKEHLTFDDRGEEVWTEIDPHVQVDHPTFYLDTSILEALKAALNKEFPDPKPDPDVQGVLLDALQDTRNVRDRILTILEVEFPK